MKTAIRTIFFILLYLALTSDPAWASHDSGQGKSQDCHGELDCLAVTPEPGTYWSFLLGAAALGFWIRSRRSHKVVATSTG
jgi:hypothetical protein